MSRQGKDRVEGVAEDVVVRLVDIGEKAPAVDDVIAEHPDNVEKFRAGEEKVLNFLMGQVMRRTEGKANPAAIRDLLVERMKA